MTTRALLLCAACLLVACVTAQFSRGANEYPIESNSVPLKQDIVFKTGDPDEERRNKLPEASLVIGIMSSPDHFEQRNAVRASWVQLQSLTDPRLNDLTTEEKQKMVIRFIIGKPQDQGLESLLAKEFVTYHDIVRVPVEETYFNLTLKTGEFLKWADSTYKFNWAFKCDDDSFVRVDKVLRELQRQPDHGVYMGKIWTGTPVDRRIDGFAPWANYAPFAAGAGYALSWDLVAYIARNFEKLHKYPMEDVAVGMWISPLRVNYVDQPHFHSFQEGCDKDMIVQNPAPAAVMREVFYHTVNGVPCHMKPDPFDPKNKNITDHVLVQLGIAKPEAGARHTKHIDPMKAIGAATMIDLDIDNVEDNSAMTMQMMSAGENNNVDEMGEEMVEERMESGHEGAAVGNGVGTGMVMDLMNGNTPSSQAVFDMNKMGHGSKSGSADETAAAEKRMNEM